MATEVKVSGSLTIKIDDETISLTSPAASLFFDLADPAKMIGTRQTLSTVAAAIDLGAVGWTDASWVMFRNASITPGEDITISRAGIVVNGTDDGSVAGASLPATLTAVGHWQRITTAGTSNGIDWEVGDIAIYKGSSGQYQRIKPAPIAKLIAATPVSDTAGPLRVAADGQPWIVKAATGTPQLILVAGGALA